MHRYALALAGALALATPALAAIDNPGPLVEADWLETRLDAPGLVILDIRNGIDGDASAVYAAGHLPGAVHAAYQAGWRTERDGVVGMTPDIASLEALISGIGIGNDEHVVIVHSGENASDFGAAARVYWTFNYLGHDAVSILDGGFRGWAADGSREVATGGTTPEPALFVAAPRPELLIETGDVEASLDDPRVLRLDARPAEQYFGAEKAGPAKAPGRIPDSIGLDQALFFTADGRIRARDEIEAILPARVKDGEVDTVVSYCNTGHWAATNWFVLSEVAELDNVRLYDASMTGWTFDPSRPLETGKGMLDALGQWVSDFRG
jgi:thiosulfate/3-mercaptopyruvate sulfurtransferase